MSGLSSRTRATARSPGGHAVEAIEPCLRMQISARRDVLRTTMSEFSTRIIWRETDRKLKWKW